jgi:ring-1,2-phenylacetyl-CoA epoxidase subunit PaaE
LTGKTAGAGENLINFRQYDEAFICGPSAMMDDAEATLKALGMRKNPFTLSALIPGTTVKRAVHVQAEGQKVTVRQDGRDREITLTADDESILMPPCVRGRICRMPVAACAPPVNAKCCAGRWTWRPTTAWSRTSWPPGMC